MSSESGNESEEECENCGMLDSRVGACDSCSKQLCDECHTYGAVCVCCEDFVCGHEGTACEITWCFTCTCDGGYYCQGCVETINKEVYCPSCSKEKKFELFIVVVKLVVGLKRFIRSFLCRYHSPGGIGYLRSMYRLAPSDEWLRQQTIAVLAKRKRNVLAWRSSLLNKTMERKLLFMKGRLCQHSYMCGKVNHQGMMCNRHSLKCPRRKCSNNASSYCARGMCGGCCHSCDHHSRKRKRFENK